MASISSSSPSAPSTRLDLVALAAQEVGAVGVDVLQQQDA